MERVPLGEPAKARTPVLNLARIGETYTGAIVRTDWREQQRKHPDTGVVGPIPKNDGTGKNKQELVVTLVTISSTMSASIGDNAAVPAAGDIVRRIIKGQTASQWIEANDKIQGGAAVGDIYSERVTSGQVYDAGGTPVGPKLTTQAELDAVPRGKTLGIYGDLTLRMFTDADSPWPERADAIRKQQDQPDRTPAASATTAAGAYGDEEPF